MRPTLTGEFIRAHRDAQVVFQRRPERWCPQLAWSYALIVDSYAIVSEFIFQHVVGSPRYIRLHEGEASRRRDRPTLAFLEDVAEAQLFEWDDAP